MLIADSDRGEDFVKQRKAWVCISQQSGVFAQSLPGWCKATESTDHDPGCGMYYLVHAETPTMTCQHVLDWDSMAKCPNEGTEEIGGIKFCAKHEAEGWSSYSDFLDVRVD